MKHIYRACLLSIFGLFSLQPAHAMQKKAASVLLNAAKVGSLTYAFGNTVLLSSGVLASEDERDVVCHKLPDASPLTTEYIKAIAPSCGVSPAGLQVKIYGDDANLSAANNCTVAVSPQTDHNLSLLIRQRSAPHSIRTDEMLYQNTSGEHCTNLDDATVAIRHELGHMHYKDTDSRRMASDMICEVGAVQTITWGLWKSFARAARIQRPTSLPMALAATAGLAASGIFKSELVEIAHDANRRRIEARADAFAFAHTANPQELTAHAEKYEMLHAARNKTAERLLNDPHIVSTVAQKQGWFHWRLAILYVLQCSYENRPRAMSSQEWIHDHRRAIHAMRFGAHPDMFTRAVAARERAAQLAQLEAVQK